MAQQWVYLMYSQETTKPVIYSSECTDVKFLETKDEDKLIEDVAEHLYERNDYHINKGGMIRLGAAVLLGSDGTEIQSSHAFLDKFEKVFSEKLKTGVADAVS